MSIMTITYPAKCKDCKNCKPFLKGNRWYHKCMHGYNKDICTFKDAAEYDNKTTTLKTKACDNFKL